MSDIVIYMNSNDFLHKTSDGIYYWSMGRAPKTFTEEDKIFFATNKHVMGFVDCGEFNPEDIGGETLVWDGDTFEYIVSIPCKQFRGFRYRWFDYELEKDRQ